VKAKTAKTKPQKKVTKKVQKQTRAESDSDSESVKSKGTSNDSDSDSDSEASSNSEKFKIDLNRKKILRRGSKKKGTLLTNAIIFIAVII